jgi:hypothetical protein
VRKLVIGTLAFSSSVVMAAVPYAVYPGHAATGASVAANSWSYYVGGDAGYSSLGFQKSFSGTPAVIVSNKKTRVPGLDLGLFAGIDKRWNHFDLATELSYDHTFGDKTSQGQDNPTTVVMKVRERMNDTFGLSLLPGYYLDNHFHPYLRVGLLASHFRSSGDQGDEIGYTGELSRWVMGYQLGVGAEYPIAKLGSGSLDLRAEYDYSLYPSFRASAFSRGENSHITVNYRSMHEHKAMLGLVYHF